MPAGPRPFRFAIPVTEIAALKRRLNEARWPDQIGNSDWSYGVEKHYLRDLVDYWRTSFDWRAAEERINRFPQYLVEIDGLDCHFIHLRSSNPDAVPLLLTHGWPGSIVEFLEAIPLLAEAFHIVCPSLPGYGGSPAPVEAGMHPGAIARRHARLMAVLGYERYIAQGGDWGSPITQQIAACDPEHCHAIHLNIVSPVPPTGIADPMALVAAHEQAWLTDNQHHQQLGMGYYHQQTTRPQTLSYGLADSPVGLAAWIAEKFHFWADCERDGSRDIRNAVSWDKLLTNISLYWFTNTIGSSIRLYKEFRTALESGQLSFAKPLAMPVGVAIYPKEIFKSPRAWVERQFPLAYWSEPSLGGHFAAMEQPEIFAKDLRKFLETVW